MKQPQFLVTEKNIQNSILIVDKKGILGWGLVTEISKNNPDVHIVFVSSVQKKQQQNITGILFGKRIPQIPNNQYSHIFEILDEDRETLDLTSEFLKKAYTDGSVFIFITFLKTYSQKLISDILNSYNNAIAFVAGDLFGPLVPLDTRQTINRYFYEAKIKQYVHVAGNGMELSYPIFFDDAVGHIIARSFSQERSSQLFLLYPKHGITNLGLSHVFHKINPGVGIDYSKTQTQTHYSTPRQGEHVFPKEYPIIKKIKESTMFNDTYSAQPAQVIKIKTKQPSRLGMIATVLYFCIAMVLLPLIVTVTFFVTGTWILKLSGQELEKGQFERSIQFAHISSVLLSVSQKTALISLIEISFLGQKDRAVASIKQIDLAKDAAVSLVEASQGLKNISRVLLGKSNNPKNDFDTAVSSFKNIVVIMLRYQTEQNPFVGKLLSKKQLITISNLFTNTIDVASSLLGFDDKKTYLILFQNNMELRPGGGFIGSYGLLTVKNGKETDFSIHDVYDADGQLKGHIEPPFAIRRYLGNVNWFMRDSNFDVDFPKNASTSAFFLQQETGTVVDGVLAVDTSFVKELLKVLGHVTVSDYHETVTADNMYELTQKHAQQDFFPGSTQKKDFLRSLLTSIELSLTEKKPVPYVKLLEAFAGSVAQKHVLLAFSDPFIQNTFTVNGLSSALWDPREEKEDSINDFLGISEANLGVNKANYFVKRTVLQTVSVLMSGAVLEQVKVSFENNSASWPGGDYKNYIRFIVPYGAVLSSIAIDGVVQNVIPAITDPVMYEKPGFTVPSALELETTQENNKTVYGFLITISEKSKKSIAISYTFPRLLPVNNSTISYDLMLFKQPGIENEPYSFSLVYPQSFKLYKSNQAVVDANGKIRFSKNVQSDEDLKFSFTRK